MNSRTHFPTKRSVITTEEPTTSGSPSASIKMSTLSGQFKLPPQLNFLLSPCFKESYFTSEYSIITNQRKLGGLYVIPSRRSVNYWFGVLFIHHGPYQGGVFRFTINFHEKFPDTNEMPQVTFQPPIFHPSIHPRRGTFDLTQCNHGCWSKSRHHIWQILRIVRNSFYKIEESTCNKEANDLLNNDLTTYFKRAQKEADASKTRLYDQDNTADNNPDLLDPHWIKFSPYNPQLHDSIRAKALKPFNKTMMLSLSSSSEQSSSTAMTMTGSQSQSLSLSSLTSMANGNSTSGISKGLSFLSESDL